MFSLAGESKESAAIGLTVLSRVFKPAENAFNRDSLDNGFWKLNHRLSGVTGKIFTRCSRTNWGLERFHPRSDMAASLVDFDLPLLGPDQKVQRAYGAVRDSHT